MRAVPRLCGFYPGTCLTTEEKARKKTRNHIICFPTAWKISRLLQNLGTRFLSLFTYVRRLSLAWAILGHTQLFILSGFSQQNFLRISNLSHPSLFPRTIHPLDVRILIMLVQDVRMALSPSFCSLHCLEWEFYFQFCVLETSSICVLP